MAQEIQFPELPQARFRSWHAEKFKTQQNPTGVCNAFPGSPRGEQDEYWIAKGFYDAPLFTVDEMMAFAREVLVMNTAPPTSGE